MYTTTKKSRMVSQLEVETSSKENQKLQKIHDVSKLEGRVVVLCFTTWYFGYCFTYMSTLGPNILIGPFTSFMTEERGVGPCFGLIPLGAAVGVIISRLVINKMSRRTYLVLLNILNLIFTGLLQIPNVYVLYVFRSLQGILVGNFMTLIPEYISDLVPKEVASKFGVYPQISVVLGVLTSYVLGVIFTDTHADYELIWRFMLAVPALPSILQLFFIIIGFIPESPYSLIIKNRREDARQVLSLFYDSEYIEATLEERENAIYNKNDAMTQDKIHYTKLGYYLGFQLSVFQVLSGIASFVTQAGHVMQFSLDQTVIGLYTPVLITISQLIGTFISIEMLKYIEWRSLTLVGGFSIAFIDALIGLFFYLYANDNQWQYSIILSMICIMAFMFTFGMTIGSSVWPYIGYLMPSNGVTAALVVNWLLAGCSIIAFSFVTANMGNPWVMMWIYCGITFVLSIFNAIFMVRIKGLSVRKVQLKLQ